MQTQPSDNSNAPPGLTNRVAQRAADIRFDALPIHVVNMAKHCFLDWVGVTVAGAREPLTEILVGEASNAGERGSAPLVGRSEQVSLYWSALINGAASHALDFDDVVSAMGGHPSVPVFPALVAQASLNGASGKDFIAAFVAGVEMECLVGSVVAPGHYARGFHATGTVGAFGAAAGVAHLSGLRRDRWGTALGLAGTQAAGLKSMFGTMAKPFHAGKAAANGLMAARLAGLGFTANEEVLEVDQGFAATQSDSFHDDAQGLLVASGSYGVSNVLFKYHAACYLTHAVIESLKQIKRERSLRAGDIKAIRLYVPAGHLKVCNIQRPSTALEAKFSLRFTAALALAREDTGEAAFTDAAANDPELVALREKVVVETAEMANNHSAAVAVEMSDGSVLEASADVSVSAKPEQFPQQWEKLVAKFHALVDPVLGVAGAEDLIERIQRLESFEDVRAVYAVATFENG